MPNTKEVEQLINACKYGYEYHATTQFPELSFEDNCKNNFLQSALSNPLEQSELQQKYNKLKEAFKYACKEYIHEDVIEECMNRAGLEQSEPFGYVFEEKFYKEVPERTFSENSKPVPATDLRLGNLVKRTGVQAEYSEVYNLNPRGVDFVIASSEDGTKVHTQGVLMSGISGIPITEEWLIKLGLVQDGNLFKPKESIHKKCQGDIGFKCPSFFFNSRLNRWMDCQTRVCVDYIHQVQNLVYQLTGEELTPITK